uniref:GDT1 family protein n=1 Tax=Ascaris lumbricoides TaxID=6252 RepID=A0A9J2PAP0_ASCLU
MGLIIGRCALLFISIVFYIFCGAFCISHYQSIKSERNRSSELFNCFDSILMKEELKSVERAQHQLDLPVVLKEGEDLSSIVDETVAKARKNETADVSFYHAILASFSVIIVSELGDKTWFIAAIMAMRHSRLTVFFGAMTALTLMTALSAGLGWATQVIPRSLTFYISTALFALFGLKMLHEGYHMSPNDGQDEYEEAHAEVHKKQLLRDTERVSEMESGSTPRNENSTYAIVRFVSTLFLEAFTLTFLAEWGDRSQLTTIILAARENVYGVVLGGIAGHALCTGIAVIGGKLVATQISVRTGRVLIST